MRWTISSLLSSASMPVLALIALACESGITPNDSGAGGAASGGSAAASGGATGSGGSGASTGGGSATGECPDGAFVSLTYEDNMASQLTNAVPALKTHGFKATFFITDVHGSSAWSALSDDGHELASHTLKHPCPAANAWVAPGNANEDYDLARMATELDDSSAKIEGLGQAAPLTFAYPCGVRTVGSEHTSYVPLVQERYTGARGVSGSIITTLADPYNVPAYFLETDGASFTNIVDQAVAQQGWVVFGFHGVGGDTNPITVEAHETLLAYLEAQAVPVLTFADGLACKKQ